MAATGIDDLPSCSILHALACHQAHRLTLARAGTYGWARVDLGRWDAASNLNRPEAEPPLLGGTGVQALLGGALEMT